MSLKIWFVIVLPLVLVSFFDAWGQTLPGKKLIVGTKQTPPFAIKKNDGTWSGLSIDLWQEISRDLELKYEISLQSVRREIVRQWGEWDAGMYGPNRGTIECLKIR